MKKILNIIFYLLIAFLIIVNILSSTYFSFLGFRILKVSSGSMEPYLKVNDLILIKQNDKYKKNDIITFKEKKLYITHRIIKIDNNEFITKGDANNIEDNSINKKDVLGKLVYKFKLLSFLCYLFTNPISWIILFILGFLIVYLIPSDHKTE